MMGGPFRNPGKADGLKSGPENGTPRSLEARGCSAIHVSSGGLTPAQRIPIGPSCRMPLARTVKAATALRTVAVGLAVRGRPTQVPLPSAYHPVRQTACGAATLGTAMPPG
jgi:hypothetical protein